MTKLTDIQIAKKLVKEQTEARTNNFQEFKEHQDFRKKKKDDTLARLKKNKYI